MTKVEFEQIQSVCGEWLRNDVSRGRRLTIPAGEALSNAVEVEISRLLTFDDVLILSAVDVDTRICYAKLIRQPDGLQEVFNTPFEKVAEALESRNSSEATPITPPHYPKRIDREVETRREITQDVEWNLAWTEKRKDDADERPKYLLLSNGKTLGYSFLERSTQDGRRRGRFHPTDDYFDFAELFAALPAAENDCMEANAREAYGIFEPDSDDCRRVFNELTARLEALKLYVADESGQPLTTSEVRLEDLSQHYDDPEERWLYVTVVTH